MRSVLCLQIEFERVGEPNRDGAYKIVSSMAYLKLIATKVDCYTPAGPGMVMICSVLSVFGPAPKIRPPQLSVVRRVENNAR